MYYAVKTLVSGKEGLGCLFNLIDFQLNILVFKLKICQIAKNLMKACGDVVWAGGSIQARRAQAVYWICFAPQCQHLLQSVCFMTSDSFKGMVHLIGNHILYEPNCHVYFFPIQILHTFWHL